MKPPIGEHIQARVLTWSTSLWDKNQHLLAFQAPEL